jgi:hypothetical protein
VRQTTFDDPGPDGPPVGASLLDRIPSKEVDQTQGAGHFAIAAALLYYEIDNAVIIGRVGSVVPRVASVAIDGSAVPGVPVTDVTS